ncbi:lipase family alpha/beta hydrolase [Iodobacter fluviatilis]|uniref:Lactonizing lipase n=1 Tax=Iodobacter fluviatilis TaxID=537 RepID=A0A377SVG4_9NEIS|nr:triacylglycerol lipase [Iodobacter fluviatilis]TCU81376.1 triacylglycerol lipase [Iodobacter fluviatilis]STR46044.1 Lactonizing lipase precursor [Iodobacter fluviatilis]
MKFVLKCFALLFSLAMPALATGYTETRYPIVLVHGLFGFDQLLGVDYFYKVPQALQADGAKVFVAQVSATNSSELRGEQLLAQVKQILAITGAGKVNLIGHSHGGPTTRYVASVRPDLVASVTNIAGVNKGSKVADVVRKTAAPGTVSESAAILIAEGLAKLIGLASKDGSLPQNANAALDALTTQGSAKFNAKFPEGLPLGACNEGAYQVNGVRYYSWSGASPVTNIIDVSDAAMGLTSLAFNEKNDGLVSSCSSHLGQVLRDDYQMNHLDEVNQFVGIVSLFETNPVSVFRQHANRLKNAGL